MLFVLHFGAPLCGKRRPRPFARQYLLKRLAVDFENFDRSTGPSVIKDADCKPPGAPRKRIQVGPVLLEDRPMCMLMVSVYDVALAVAAVIIVWIDFPYDVFCVLLTQRTVWIDARVYENTVPIDIDQR
jgi:hypothetical protein